MGLLQKAVETYDCHAAYAGIYRADHAVLAPIAHIVTRASLEITLDRDGNFCEAIAVDKSEPKILIPATESSAGRSGSTICAHPLCDQLCYIAPYNSGKFQNYIEKLTKWSMSEFSHPMLLPILNYCKKGTILEDLAGCNLITIQEGKNPIDEKTGKLLVRWRVLNVCSEDASWRNQELFRAFSEYYLFCNQGNKQNVCMITGDTVRSADQHPKGIVAFNGNAKLISANDKTGFTYRGRFTDIDQAVTIGYEASQKAHNALRWLVSEQGSQAVFGGRTFLCWNPQGRKVCTATGAFACFAKAVTRPTEYREALHRTLIGYKSELPEGEGVVIAAFDAATSGRLSLTYYNELLGSDFLQRLYQWDLHCCWHSYQFGIQSPGFMQIVNCAYGNQQTEKNKTILVTDDRIMKQQIQRLVACRLDCSPIPADLVLALKNKASSPLKHEKSIREKILFTACAVIRKYRFDRFKEEWDMNLEPEKKDISYQYGRLLAVLEKVERSTYESNTEREPNAIRQQSVFCQRPMYAAANIEKQLERAYYPRLRPGSRIYYKNLISDILAIINTFPQEQWNKPLKETYLMGYYLQRAAFYTKQECDKEEQDHE